MAPKFMI